MFERKTNAIVSLRSGLVPCCDVRYHFHIKTMVGSSLPPVQLFVGGLMSYLRYLCLFVHSGV